MKIYTLDELESMTETGETDVVDGKLIVTMGNDRYQLIGEKSSENINEDESSGQEFYIKLNDNEMIRESLTDEEKFYLCNVLNGKLVVDIFIKVP
jgi:hypothetical protein